jgi:lysophospholipase L1-like esterase
LTRRRAVWLLSAALPACAIALFVQQWSNTLYNNGRWDSSKVELGKGVIGAVSFYTTRTALHGGALDLAAWGGHQEVLPRGVERPSRASCRFRLTPGAEFVFLYDKDERGYSGLRFSWTYPHLNTRFRATAAGGFVSVAPMDLIPSEQQWNDLVVTFGSDSVGVRLNGVAADVPRSSAPAGGRLGFRGGNQAVYLDDVVVEPSGPGRRFREGFSNRRGWALVLALSAAGILGLDGFLWVLFRRRSAPGPWDLCVLANASVFACVLVLLVYDARVTSALYPPPERVDFKGISSRVEAREESVRRIRAAAREAPPGGRRILFLGGSQTWGAGASRDGETFVALLERELNARASAARPVRCLNAGVSGYDAGRMLDLYRMLQPDFRPDLLVVVASCNESSAAAFESRLEEILSFNRERGVDTLFVLEANELGIGPAAATQTAYHAVMRRVAARRGVPALDMHGCLTREADKGFLWWDWVHLTDYGHRLAADCLAEELSAGLERR